MATAATVATAAAMSLAPPPGAPTETPTEAPTEAPTAALQSLVDWLGVAVVTAHVVPCKRGRVLGCGRHATAYLALQPPVAATDAATTTAATTAAAAAPPPPQPLLLANGTQAVVKVALHDALVLGARVRRAARAPAVCVPPCVAAACATARAPARAGAGAGVVDLPRAEDSVLYAYEEDAADAQRRMPPHVRAAFVAREVVGVIDAARDDGPCLRLAQFWAQAAVSALVARHVAPLCPHVLGGGACAVVTLPPPQTQARARGGGGGGGGKGSEAGGSGGSGLSYVFSERAHGNLQAVLRWHGGEAGRALDLDATRAIVWQQLVALHAAQTAIGLKHHDAHAENWFVLALHPPRPPALAAAAAEYPLPPSYAHLADAAIWQYVLGGRTYAVPNCGWLLKLGDWDMAAAAVPALPRPLDAAPIGEADRFCGRVENAVDTLDDSHATVREWGEWGGALAGARGYDAQVALVYLLRHRSSFTPAAAAWLDAVQARLGGPRIFTRSLRPRKGTVSDLPPGALLLDDILFGDWVCTPAAAADTGAPLVYTDAAHL